MRDVVVGRDGVSGAGVFIACQHWYFNSVLSVVLASMPLMQINSEMCTSGKLNAFVNVYFRDAFILTADT